MYDFKCIYYEFAVDFIIIGLGGLGVLISSHFWDTKKRHKGKMIMGVFLVGLCIYFTAFQYIPACVNPKINVFDGEYVYSNGTFRGSIISREYSFSDDGGKHSKSFTLDSVNKKKIYPDDFEKGETYRIYYEERTKIIVRVED